MTFEERHLFNADLAESRGGKIANNWLRTQTSKRSAVGRQAGFKASDEVGKVAFTASPRRACDAGCHPALNKGCESRTPE